MKNKLVNLSILLAGFVGVYGGLDISLLIYVVVAGYVFINAKKEHKDSLFISFLLVASSIGAYALVYLLTDFGNIFQMTYSGGYYKFLQVYTNIIDVLVICVFTCAVIFEIFNITIKKPKTAKVEAEKSETTVESQPATKTEKKVEKEEEKEGETEYFVGTIDDLLR